MPAPLLDSRTRYAPHDANVYPTREKIGMEAEVMNVHRGETNVGVTLPPPRSILQNTHNMLKIPIQ